MAVGDLSVFFYDRVLLLSAGMDYDSGDIDNQLAHITNTARQAEGECADTEGLEGFVGD
jgi:hypothetical protein